MLLNKTDCSITVLITTYNAAATIGDSIESILCQSYPHFELLIIDDGSEDGTREVVSKFNDPRIRYIFTKHRGRASALNYGLTEATHEWVALQDADDISVESRLEKQVDLIGNRNIVVFGNALFLQKNKVIFCQRVPNKLTSSDMMIHSYVINSTVMFNGNYVLENGGYNQNLDSVEDYDLFVRLGSKLEYRPINEILVLCRWYPHSLSRKNYDSVRHNFYITQKKYFFDNSDDCISPYMDKIDVVKGWREFYYGNKTQARNYWRKKSAFIKSSKQIFAYILTFLPEKIFMKMLSNDWIPRIKYIFFESLNAKKENLSIVLRYMPSINNNNSKIKVSK